MSARSFAAVALGVCLLWLGAWRVAVAQDSASETFDWRSEWAVADGLRLDRDTEGYHLPIAIAFVPEPGTGPKDPLYFVTELRGKVKVVTNDRSVYTFAEDFVRSRPLKELPEFAGETGLAGICLAPAQGYVFVTFAYRDVPAGSDPGDGEAPRMASGRAGNIRREGGILRNDIVRFETRPRTFSVQPSGRRAFTELFAGYEAAISHQIGSCVVVGDVLHVSVGDGWQTAESQRVDSLLGKVLRMTLDGRPAPGNPFQRDASTAAGFVWAYGFRNPFGLKAVGDRLFAADNGLKVDRFVEVRAGENYLWDGTDWSIGTRAGVTLSPGIGPAQLEYHPARGPLPDSYRQSFFVAASSLERPGVLRFVYRLPEGKAGSVPEYVVRYRGSGRQIVTGVAIGPDGLYFVPTLPDARGRSAVLKAAYRPDQPHPYPLTHATDPRTLIEERGCLGCHALDGKGTTIGPPLDRRPLVERLERRLHAKAYAESVRTLDSLEREPFRRFREARAEVLQASGRQKLRAWMTYHLMEPKFDNPGSQMPNLGLSRAEATLITDYLLREARSRDRPRPSWLERGGKAVLRLLPAPLRPSPLASVALLAFGAGLIGGLLLTFVPRAAGRLGRGRRP